MARLIFNYMLVLLCEILVSLFESVSKKERNSNETQAFKIRLGGAASAKMMVMVWQNYS